MRLQIAVLAALCALPAFAQTAGIDSTDVSRGVNQLPTSAAFVDDPAAVVLNPAGLGRVGGLSLLYLHERSNVRRQDGDGVYLATDVGDVLGLGFSVESLRPDGAPGRTRLGLGLSVGTDALSLGASLGWLRGGANGLTTLDLGLQTRPLRWLSFGAMVRNVPPSNVGGLRLPREWTVGLGLRPFGERLTVGVDWIAPESATATGSRLQYTLQAQVVKGVRVLAGVAHGFTPTSPLALHLGLGLDLEHLGYTQGLSTANGGFNHQFAVRLSSEPHASVVRTPRIAVVSLADVGEDGGSTLGTILGVKRENRFLRTLRWFEKAADDPLLAGVVVKVEGASVGLARAGELRAAILKLRAKGKKVYAYLLSVGDAEYLFASACDGMYAAPEAMLMVDGLRSTATFFGGTAERLGIDVDVARVGAYKNFPDQFTRTDMSEEQREALTAYLDAAERSLAGQVLEARKLTPERWRQIVDEGLKPVPRAKELGEIDDVLDPGAFDELLKDKLPDAQVDKKFRPLAEREGRWGGKPVIAVVPVLGAISGGKDVNSPLDGDIAGAESFIQAIASAAADEDVKAIVLRVDSGGGDGLASDLMYRAVLQAKEKKPVIASMGDVAASGGYYVAMGAQEVWASPSTLTGSIGVFFAKPAVKRLAESFGVHQEALSRGRLAGMTDLYEPWNEEQRAAAQKWVDSFYDTFITEVASSRGLTKDQVDAVARGRVWSGADAKERKLVDQLGGLMDAIASARAKAGLTDEDVSVEVWRAKGGVLSGLAGAVVPRPALETKVPGVTDELGALKKALGPSAWILSTAPRVQARLEQTIEVR